MNSMDLIQGQEPRRRKVTVASEVELRIVGELSFL